MNSHQIVMLLVIIISSGNTLITNQYEMTDSFAIPALLCDEKPLGRKNLMVECEEHCNTLGLGNEKILTIYKGRADHTKIPIWTCTKWRREVTYTETWTFSKIPPTIKTVQIAPDPASCRETRENLCKGFKCRVNPPSIKESYNWASDTSVVEEYTIVDQSREMEVFYSGEDPCLLIDKKNVKVTDQSFNSGKSHLMWIDFTSKDRRIGLCPFATTKENMYCYEINNKLGFYCPREGLTIPSFHKMDDSRCDNINVAHLGFAFSVRDPVPADDPTKWVLPPQSLTTSASDKEREIINSIVATIKFNDMTSCLGRCYEFDYHSRHPQLMGRGFYYASYEGLHKCWYYHHCELVAPVQVCPGTDMVLATCGLDTKWLNASNSFSWSQSVCHNTPDIVDTTIVSDLVIVNKSGIFYNVSHWNDQFYSEVLSPSKLKVVADTQLSTPYVLSDTITDLRNLTRTASHLPIIDDIANMTVSVFGSITHEIRVILFSIIFILVGLIMVKLLPYLKSEPKTRTLRVAPLMGSYEMITV
ncbi:TPA_asm: G [Trifolium betacytorhabdovirus 1]|nr:TPA_asm: G [Trifolium betacytorhabdovirus 1]